MYSVFESFEDNAAWEKQPALACQTAISRNLVPNWLENPVGKVWLEQGALNTGHSAVA